MPHLSYWPTDFRQVPEYLKVKVMMLMFQNQIKLNNASVVFLIDNKEIECHGVGNGPVNALDNAIRSNFSKVAKYYNFF